MAIQERSAGVILTRTSPEGGGRLFLLLDYGKYWDYPKGHVEAGESDQAAARRELVEETGIDRVSLVPGFTHEMTYFFRSKRGLVRKTVVFFLGETEREQVKVSDEHVGFAWLEYAEALNRLNYATARGVLAAAKTYLDAERKAG